MSRRLTAIASATPRSSDSMPGIRRRRVDEDDDRPAELLGEPHGPQRLAIALGPRVAEVAVDLFLGVAALDVPHEQHRLALVVGKAGHDRVVVGKAAIAVNLDEAGEQPLDEVLEARAVRVPRDQHALPRRQRARRDRRAATRGGARSESISLIARVGAGAAAMSASISFRSDAIGSSKSSVSGHTVTDDLTCSDTDPVADDLLDFGDQRRGGTDADLVRRRRPGRAGAWLPTAARSRTRRGRSPRCREKTRPAPRTRRGRPAS